MKNHLIGSIIFLLAAAFNSYGQDQLLFSTKYGRFAIDSKGQFASVLANEMNKEYLALSEKSPILSLGTAIGIHAPNSLSYSEDKKIITLKYIEINTEVAIKVKSSDYYMSFELIEIISDRYIETAIWGPYATIVSKSIGETVGVVRDDDVAIGIQGLNLKTLGGYPSQRNDVTPSYSIFDQDDYVDLKETDKTLYRGQTASLKPFGSIIQAYSRDRTKERIVKNMNHDAYSATAIKGENLIGSKIALFICPRNKALEVIGQIEIHEGLPHPLLNGEWIKTNPEATASYLIFGFSEKTLEKGLSFAKMAGLKYLYHGGPFLTWGNFELNKKAFPEGEKSLRSYAKLAEKKGISLGVHTLSNFITTNDKYVDPMPHDGLAAVGSGQLVETMDEHADQIVIDDPLFFSQMKNNNLHTIRIDDELIRYEEVSTIEPWTLLNCQRGVYGTENTSHNAKSRVIKLADHGYKTFLAGHELQKEMAIKLANLYNATGLKQISFDGLEGCNASGHGQYATSRFAKIWYEHLNPELQGQVINDASMPGHYFWHIYTRMNWGEPWYAGFRESQLHYRLKNQEYFDRNLMPNMLGWFNFTSKTSYEDLEWLMARSAGFDAGFGLNINPEALKNGLIEDMLKTLKNWESARLQGLFTEKQKKQLKDINTEFQLVGVDSMLTLYPIANTIVRHQNRIKQPGEPLGLYSKYSIENQFDTQPLQFTMMLENNGADDMVSEIVLEINDFKNIAVPVDLKPEQIIKYSGGDELHIYDQHWNIQKSISVDTNDFLVPSGKLKLNIECQFKGSEGMALKMELKTKGVGTQIGKVKHN